MADAFLSLLERIGQQAQTSGSGSTGSVFSEVSGEARPGSGGSSYGLDFSQIGPSYSTSSQSGSSYSSGSSQSSSSGGSHSGLSEEGQNALHPLLGTGQGSMPSMIDAWANDLVKGYRVSAEDTIRALNAVANKRAQQGIMGGTEAENLRANTLSNLSMAKQDLANNAILKAMDLKTDVIPKLIALTQEADSHATSSSSSTQSGSSSSAGSSYSTSPDDYRIIADLIMAGYTG